MLEQDGYANGVYQRVVSWIGWFEEFRREKKLL